MKNNYDYILTSMRYYQAIRNEDPTAFMGERTVLWSVREDDETT